MTTKHTPGPWKYFRDGDSADIIAPDGGHVASVEPVNCLMPEGVQDANGTLLAAAPDLLAALEAVLALIHEGGDEQCLPGAVAQEARAAIAKAKGEA